MVETIVELNSQTYTFHGLEGFLTCLCVDSPLLCTTAGVVYDDGQQPVSILEVEHDNIHVVLYTHLFVYIQEICT